MTIKGKFINICITLGAFTLSSSHETRIFVPILFFSIKFEAVYLPGGGLYQRRKHTLQHSVEQ